VELKTTDFSRKFIGGMYCCSFWRFSKGACGNLTENLVKEVIPFATKALHHGKAAAGARIQPLQSRVEKWRYSAKKG
jgi:hypothetical protein